MTTTQQDNRKQQHRHWHWALLRIGLLTGATCFSLHLAIQQWSGPRVHHYRDHYGEEPIPEDTKVIPPIPQTWTDVAFEGQDPAGEDWPGFRGKRRDAICDETGLLQAWPQDGPPRLLTIHGIGEGYSSPVISNGRLLISGTSNQRSLVYCFATDGNPLWQQDNGPAYKCTSYPGTRSTATVDASRVYVLSAIGRITVFELDSGKQLWSRNILRDFDGPLIMYGLAESPLIYRDRVICTPGGLGGEVVALDKITGKTIWIRKGTNDAAGYGSPLIMRYHGRDVLLATLHHSLMGLDPEDGHPFWRYALPFAGGRICLTPIIAQESQGVFLMGGERCGGGAIQLQGENVEIGYRELWRLPKARTHLGGYVMVAGKIYGADGKGWGCRDFATGILHYQIEEPRRCSTIYADNRFICCEPDGMVYLIAADAKQAKVVSQFRSPNGTRQVWARPVISHKRLYLRCLDQLHVFDIKRSRSY